MMEPTTTTSSEKAVKSVPLVRISYFLFWFVAFLALDQGVKAWCRHKFVIGEKLAFPIPNVFEITLTYNKGIAFGFFQGSGVLFAPVAILITLWAFLFCRQHSHERRWVHLAAALLASGAIGNLIDRVWLGKVTDMLWFRAINFPVFNIADSCITIGALMFALRFIFEPKGQGSGTDMPITNT